MATACVSESLKMPATAEGNCICIWDDGVERGVPGAVLGVESSPVIVRGAAAFSMVERWEASEPCSLVIECSQSDFPVEMTTWFRIVIR
jgi:hypothetical protein